MDLPHRDFAAISQRCHDVERFSRSPTLELREELARSLLPHMVCLHFFAVPLLESIAAYCSMAVFSEQYVLICPDMS